MFICFNFFLGQNDPNLVIITAFTDKINLFSLLYARYWNLEETKYIPD